MKNSFFAQSIKYIVVGIINTLLTLVVIWLMRNVFHTPLVVANVTGYVLGFINSFLLNRSWTFKSFNDWKKEFIKFLMVFFICYLIQLGVLLLLEKYTGLKETYNVLIGMVVYTALNFLFNKYFTFKK